MKRIQTELCSVLRFFYFLHIYTLKTFDAAFEKRSLHHNSKQRYKLKTRRPSTAKSLTPDERLWPWPLTRLTFQQVHKISMTVAVFFWPHDFETFTVMPTHVMNICGKFHWNPSTKYRDNTAISWRLSFRRKRALDLAIDLKLWNVENLFSNFHLHVDYLWQGSLNNLPSTKYRNTPCPGKNATLFFAITLPNPNRSSTFFYRHAQQ